jgi:hypothetical protein
MSLHEVRKHLHALDMSNPLVCGTLIPLNRVCARLAAVGCVVFPALAGACTMAHRDMPQAGNDAGRSVLGADDRLRDVFDPAQPKHPRVKPGERAPVRVSGISVVHVDNFDETRDGKGRGTIYIQDLGSHAPYSGTSLYLPSFVPTDLRVVPGDVLDLAGQYMESSQFGPNTVFPVGDVVIQLAYATGRFRFESTTVQPTDIDLNDLTTFTTGRQWLGMLVRVRNVTIPIAPIAKADGRISVAVAGDVGNRRANPALITNEFYNLQLADIAAGKRFAEVVGVVTYFYSFNIAPRSSADIVPAREP